MVKRKQSLQRCFSSLLAVATVLVELSTLSAQTSYTLADLEKRVAARSFSAAAFGEKQRSLQSQLSADRARSLPELSTFYRYYPRGVALDEENLSNSHILSLRLSQDLIKFFKVRPGKSREIQSQIEVARAQMESRTLKELYEFRMNYLDILENQMLSHAYEALIEKYDQLLHIERVRYRNQEALLPAVLEVESELLNYDGLLKFAQSRLRNQKASMSASLALDPQDILWDEPRLHLSNTMETEVLSAALNQNPSVQAQDARANVEHWRAATARYNDIKLAPFVGLRVQGDSFSRLNTGPEFGLRFSMPLAYFSAGSSKQHQYEANERYWQLQAREETADLKQQLSLLLDKYRLAEARIKHSEKMLQLEAENLRIERSVGNKKFNGSTVTPTNLVNSEIAKLEAEIDLRRSQHQRARIYYEILFRAGIPPTADLLPDNEYSSRPREDRALWAWRTAEVLDSPETSQRLLKTCEGHNINRLFLSLNRRLLDSLPSDTALHNIVAGLHRKGVGISALMGDPHWVLNDQRENLLQKVRQFLRANSALPPVSQFDGLHLDIEPQTLENWSENSLNLLTGLAATVAAVKTTIKASGQKLALELDLPVFFDKVSETTLAKIVELADTVVLMAYGKTGAQSILSAIEVEVEYLSQTETTFMLGLNIKDFDSPASLERTISELRSLLSTNPWFGGFAIHDYHHLVEEQNES